MIKNCKKMAFKIIVVSLIYFTIQSGISFAGATISIPGGSALGGRTTTISFPAPYKYLNIVDANSIVTRLRIKKSGAETIYYDNFPRPGESITLFPGEYRISCWSNFGDNIPNCVTLFLSDGTDQIQYALPVAAPHYQLNLPVVLIPYSGAFPVNWYPYYNGYYNLPYAGSYKSSSYGVKINAVINIK